MKNGDIDQDDIIYDAVVPTFDEHKTDWARVEALTPEEVHAAALADPDAQPLTPEQLARMQRVPNARRIRAGLNHISLERFARLYRIPRETLRSWEDGTYIMDGPAKALLRIIEREPMAAALALNPDLTAEEIAPELGLTLPERTAASA